MLAMKHKHWDVVALLQVGTACYDWYGMLWTQAVFRNVITEQVGPCTCRGVVNPAYRLVQGEIREETRHALEALFEKVYSIHVQERAHMHPGHALLLIHIVHLSNYPSCTPTP